MILHEIHSKNLMHNYALLTYLLIKFSINLSLERRYDSLFFFLIEHSIIALELLFLPDHC